MRIPLFGPQYTPQSVIAESEITQNWYAERIESGMGKDLYSFYPSPGLTLGIALGAWAVRGMYTDQFTLKTFAVAQEFATGDVHLLKITGTSTYVDDGVMYNTAPVINYEPVKWASSGVFLLISFNGRAFSVNLATEVITNVTAAITAAVGAAGGYIEFMDGYFLATGTNNQLGASALNDPTVWSASNVVVPSAGGGRLTGLKVNNRILWVFCQDRIEPFYDAANPVGFPFAPVQGAVIQQGMNIDGAIIRVGNTVYWPGSLSDATPTNTMSIQRSNGYSAERISTHAIENDLLGVVTAGWYTQHNGHVFMVFHNTQDKVTRIYDLSSGWWYKWVSQNANFPERYMGYSHCLLPNNKTELVGDWDFSGNIYVLQWNVYDEAGTKIKRVRRFPHINNEKKQIKYFQLQIDMEVGLGVDQRLELDISNDGGKTWLFSGTVNTNGTAVARVSGALFNSSWAGSLMRIGTTYYTISSVTDTQNLVLGSSAGVQANVEYAAMNIVNVGTASGMGNLARARWDRLGSARDRVFQITAVDGVAYNLTGGYLELEAERS